MPFSVSSVWMIHLFFIQLFSGWVRLVISKRNVEKWCYKDAPDHKFTIFVVFWKGEVIYEFIALHFNLLFLWNNELKIIDVVWLLLLDEDFQCLFKEGFDFIFFTHQLVDL